jgi:NADP-dependent 3-hydroxy acid dehydrogenase YdfG
MDNFKNKVIIITGATSGIGEETVKKFAQLGAKVVLVARRKDRLKIVEDQINESGGECFFVKTDVSKKMEVEKLIDKVVEKWGRIDIYVSNAGQYVQGSIIDIDVDEFSLSFDNNFYPSVYATQKLIPIMTNQKSGLIVFINTLDAKKGIIGDAAYVCAKSALKGFADVLRQEVKELGIRIITVFPGRVDTPMVEDIKVPWYSPKIAPSKVTKAVIRGIKRNKLTVTTPVIFSPIGILNELFPGFMDWLFKKLKLEGVKQ